MGSLAGNVYPGCFFIAYGLTWCILSIWFQLTLNKKKTQNLTQEIVIDLQRKSWLPVCLFPRFPLEPIFKIVLPAVGIFIEAFIDYRTDENGEKTLTWRVFHVYDEQGFVRDQGKLNHITMESAFLVSGIVDLLTLFVRLPALTSKVSLSLAFFTQLIISYVHSHGQNEFYTILHSITAFIFLISFFFSLIRISTPSNRFINLGLGSSILLLGTWFIQVGYLLSSGFICSQEGMSVHHEEHGMSEHEDDEPNTHELRLFFAEAFACHILLNIVGNLVLWVILSLVNIFAIRRKRVQTNVQLSWHATIVKRKWMNLKSKSSLLKTTLSLSWLLPPLLLYNLDRNYNKIHYELNYACLYCSNWEHYYLSLTILASINKNDTYSLITND